MGFERAIRTVCVFCGSSDGARLEYREAVAHLGRLLAESGRIIVYGGGSVGLMGVLADAALASGGHVIGVIPGPLATREVAHRRLTEMRVVPGMHSRKALMAELADAFIAVPGGFGTLEELLETITWAQLGIHAKPIGLLNIAGYYDRLLRLIDHAEAEGFIRPEYRGFLMLAEDPAELLSRLAREPLPAVPRWMTPEEA